MLRKGESGMTRFVQICASQNDLFALDADGDIHQYHFNVKTWVKLPANRESEDGVPAGVTRRQKRGQQESEGRAGGG
jgi:hypothetical protein